MTTYRSLNHTKWHCQYHVVFIPKYRKQAIYGGLREQLNRSAGRAAMIKAIPDRNCPRRIGARDTRRGEE